MNSSVRAAKDVMSAITAIIPEDVSAALAIDSETLLDWRLNTLKHKVGTFETIMNGDMPDIASYIVSQKGIYRTDDLIAHAENHLSAASKAALPNQACEDLREAGRCLAYEVPTACAFHLWRTVESVMAYYYVKLSGVTFEDAGVQRNWGAYIPALTAVGAPVKITAFLSHIKDEYRNPQTHPDEPVPIEEAQRLFSTAISSVEQMMLEAAKVTVVTPPPVKKLKPAAMAAIASPTTG